jgi:hypothetical protein
MRGDPSLMTSALTINMHAYGVRGAAGSALHQLMSPCSMCSTVPLYCCRARCRWGWGQNSRCYCLSICTSSCAFAHYHRFTVSAAAAAPAAAAAAAAGHAFLGVGISAPLLPHVKAAPPLLYVLHWFSDCRRARCRWGWPQGSRHRAPAGARRCCTCTNQIHCDQLPLFLPYSSSYCWFSSWKIQQQGTRSSRPSAHHASLSVLLLLLLQGTLALGVASGQPPPRPSRGKTLLHPCIARLAQQLAAAGAVMPPPAPVPALTLPPLPTFGKK